SALAACGAPSATSPTGSAASRQPATLSYITEPGRVNSGVKQVVDLWNAKGTPITIALEGIPGSFSEKVLTTAAAGAPADIIHTHPRDYHAWLNAGALLSIDDRIKKERHNVPDLLPTALEYWNRDGKLWALPYNLSVQNLYFNKDLFAKHGLKSPEQHEKDGTWTWDTYLDLARRLTTGSGETKVFGAVWRAANLDILLGTIWPFGGDLWDKAMTRTVLDSKESVESLQFVADLHHKYGISPSDDEWRQFEAAPSNTWGAAFSAGRAALEIQPNDSLAPHIIPAPFQKGNVPMPKGRAGRIVRGLAVGVHLTKGSKHNDAAWEFANFHADKESEKIMLDLHLTLPWHKSSFADLAKSMPLLPWESAAAYNEDVKRLRPTPYVSQFSEINRIWVAAFTGVRKGERTASQAIMELKPQIDSLLKS
ncbi:MAG TPA: sugar ABC transporter substrate-binding protein, partial [Chloroflexota bacterium]|nr:sugar ABC transporter substrate-binding protein [Chloroflexota bacterium]